MQSIQESAIQTLKTTQLPGFSGDLVFPDSPDYEQAISRWSASSICPAGVVAYPRDEHDVSTLIKWCVGQDVEFVVCGGGHSSGSWSSIIGGLVIHLGRHLTSVIIHPENKTAVVAGGARWGAVEQEAIKHGLGCMAGAVADTGVGGLALGGGIGHLQGTMGIVVDNMLEVTIVLASGEIVKANADSHLDLFWAVRGGGGAFGCVTSFTFRLHDQRPTVSVAMAFYPAEQTTVLLPKIRKWLAVRGPKENGYLAFVVHEGNSVVLFGGVYNGPLDEAQQKFGDILETAMMGKEMREIPYEGLNRQLEAFLKPGLHTYASTATIRSPSDELILDLEKLWAETNSTKGTGIERAILAVEWHNWEAANKIDPHATPFYNRALDQTLCIFSTEYSADVSTGAKQAAEKFRDIVGADLPGYLNLGSDESVKADKESRTVERARLTFGEKNFERLKEIKKVYDHDGRFRSWFM